MKKFIYLMGVVLSTFCCYAQEVDVILIGGQSNATGQGYLVNLPNQFKTNEKVMIYYSRFLKMGMGPINGNLCVQRWKTINGLVWN